MGRPHRIDLPGLAGDEPLGFLAAVGLLNQLIGSGCLLSWDPQDRHAILHSDRCSSIDDVVDGLLRHLGNVEAGWAIPYETRFPLPRRPGGPDPLRMRPAELRDRFRLSKNGLGWLGSTLTTATDADGYCTVNPLIAVRGRQTIGSFWYYPMLELRKAPRQLLTEALTGWRRVDGADGWLLDHRATYSADPGLRGPGGSMAVPGATWLATLATRTFGYDTSGAVPGTGRLAAGWFQAGGQDVFLWPLWTLPVSGGTGGTLEAVWRAGWSYGHWELTAGSDGAMQALISKTHSAAVPNARYQNADLGIFAMHAAARPSPKSPLTPLPVRMYRKPDERAESPAWKGWDWQYPDPNPEMDRWYR